MYDGFGESSGQALDCIYNCGSESTMRVSGISNPFIRVYSKSSNASYLVKVFVLQMFQAMPLAASFKLLMTPNFRTMSGGKELAISVC